MTESPTDKCVCGHERSSHRVFCEQYAPGTWNYSLFWMCAHCDGCTAFRLKEAGDD